MVFLFLHIRINHSDECIACFNGGSRFVHYLFVREASVPGSSVRSLKVENMQIRYQALKNQVDPHFLFNTMSILDSLVDEDKQRTHEYIRAFPPFTVTFFRPRKL